MIPPAAASRSAGVALRLFLRSCAADRPALDGTGPLGVAFSGGADSTALLLAARRLWPRRRVVALHVHHGLQRCADDFSEHARRQCAQWDVECRVLDVRVPRRRGDSVEEQARRVRHESLQRAARELGCAWLLLAQHADDQAETLLLALLRGAGPAGLAAMPAAVERGGVWVGRPLLACSAEQLRAELDAAGVSYVDDPMNADPALRRSRIRHELLPVIAALEPGWRRTLGRSAAWCAQAAQELRRRAGEDLAGSRGEHGLRLQALSELDAPRRSEVLRAWLLELGMRTNAAQIDNLSRQIGAAEQRAVHVRIGALHLWRDGPWLCCGTGPPPEPRRRRL